MPRPQGPPRSPWASRRMQAQPLDEPHGLRGLCRELSPEQHWRARGSEGDSRGFCCWERGVLPDVEQHRLPRSAGRDAILWSEGALNGLSPLDRREFPLHSRCLPCPCFSGSRSERFGLGSWPGPPSSWGHRHPLGESPGLQAFSAGGDRMGLSGAGRGQLTGVWWVSRWSSPCPLPYKTERPEQARSEPVYH